MMSSRKYLVHLAIISTFIFLTLGAFELAIRYVGRFQKIISVQKISSGWLWNQSPLRYLQNNNAILQSNQLGLRGQKIEYASTDYVVLLLGDSQVEAAASSLNQMPEILLEQRLSQKLNKKVKVFSVAAAGWGQDQQLLALQKYFQSYRADLVLLWLTPHNDYWENTFVDRGTHISAGAIKPTFGIQESSLMGPYYEGSFYLMHSALFQLMAQALTSLTAEQILVNQWQSNLPKPILMQSDPNVCRGNIEIEQTDFFRNIYELDLSKRYTIVSAEDFLHGRGHFGPYVLDTTIGLGDYQMTLSALLLDKLKQTAENYGAQFKAFYPIQDSLDTRVQLANCIKHPGGATYPLSLNYQRRLRQTVRSDHLVMFPIYGKDENVVSKNDRHLNITGNKKVAEILVSYLID